MTPLELLFWFLVGHALCDFPLQESYLAKAKNRHNKLQYNSTPVANDVWIWCLTWHALIHAGAVMVITGRLEYALTELILHWTIDFFRCEDMYDFGVDQAFHVACKVGYVVTLSFVT